MYSDNKISLNIDLNEKNFEETTQCSFNNNNEYFENITLSFDGEFCKKSFLSSNNNSRRKTKEKYSEKTGMNLSGSIIALTVAAIGAGWLSLPKAFSIFGMGLGSFAMVLTYLSTFLTFKLFSR